MLAEPKYGWTEFTFENFKCSPSYLTDVPIDMLSCIESFLKTGSGACWFDCEGSTYTFILSPDGAYIISDGNKLQNLTPENYLTTDCKFQIAQEIIHDIETHLDSWTTWEPNALNEQEPENYKRLLIQKIQDIRKLISE